MVDGEASIVDAAPALETAAEDRRNIIGNRVMTDAGRDVGRVVDLILRIDRTVADVAGYEIEAADGSRSLLPIPATFAVSGETVVVPAAVESYVTDDLTGFGAAVDRFRI